MSTLIKIVSDIENETIPTHTKEHPGIQHPMRWRHGKVPSHRNNRQYTISYSADTDDKDDTSSFPAISEKDTNPSSTANMPSQTPTIIRSEKPSYSPSIEPSISPRPTESSIPSMKPSETSLLECKADRNGNFGKVEPSSGNIIQYKYGILTKSALNDPYEAIHRVEIAVLDYILPQILGKKKCRENRALEQTRLRNSRQLSTIIGASIKPKDMISSSESCIAENSSDKCSIVNGQMQFYSGGNASSLLANVPATICKAMSDGEFNTALVHPLISSVYCVNSSDFLFSDESFDNIDRPPVEPVSQSVSATPLVFSAFAALIVVCGVYIYRRRLSKEGRTSSPRGTAYLDDSDLPNTSGSFSSDTYPDQTFIKGVPSMDFSSIDLPKHLDSRKNGSILFPDSIEESLDEDSDSMTETSLMHVVSLE